MLNRDGLFAKRDPRTDETARKEASAAPYAPQSANVLSPGSARPALTTDAVKTLLPATAEVKSVPGVSEGSKLIVGPNIQLKGVEISNCDVLSIEGHVEATVTCRALHIAQPGTFNGHADIEVAEIQGEFTGELTVRKKLVIQSNGKVSGKIRYGKLVIEEGGELSGDVKNIGATDDPGAGLKPYAPAAPKLNPPPLAHH